MRLSPNKKIKKQENFEVNSICNLVKIMDNNKKILVYSSPDCAYCYTLKDYLKSKGVEFQEINIYEDEQGYEDMKAISKQNNVPVLLIGDDFVIGWDKKKINELIGL